MFTGMQEYMPIFYLSPYYICPKAELAQGVAVPGEIGLHYFTGPVTILVCRGNVGVLDLSELVKTAAGEGRRRQGRDAAGAGQGGAAGAGWDGAACDRRGGATAGWRCGAAALTTLACGRARTARSGGGAGRGGMCNMGAAGGGRQPLACG